MRISMVSDHANPLDDLNTPHTSNAPGADGVDGVDGQSIYVAALSTELGRLGHDVTVYTRRRSPEQPERQRLAAGVTVHHVTAGPPRPLTSGEQLPHLSEFGRELAERWRDEPPDVVHSHYWTSGIAALAAARDLGAGLPLVHTFHTLGAMTRRHGGPRRGASRVRLERALAGSVASVIALSSDEAIELVRGGADRRRIQVIPAGVDPERFCPNGNVPDRSHVLAAGPLTERKGYEALIQALPALPGTELRIAAGPPRDTLNGHPEYGRLDALASRLGVSDRVQWLGGVGHDEMPDLIRSATVVACTPRYEPFGMVALEAMACAVPVVATSVGGLLDTVVDGATGLHVPPRRTAELASTLRSLLENPFRREGYGIAGRDRVRSRYTWERVGRDMLAAYEEASARGTAPLAAVPS